MNLKRTAALVATSTLLTGLAGCGVQPTAVKPGMSKVGTYNAAAKRRAERGGKWTILMHMAAENNLYSYGLEDLNEMEAGLPTDGSVDMYVLFDGLKDGDSCIYHIKRDTGKNGQIISEVVNDGGAVIPASHEIDSGSADVAKKFVTWAAKNAPADHTFLGYWDHGSGIFQSAPNPITKGFAWDDKGSNMTTADITGIAGAFKAAAGKPLDVLGFDACLMSHGEIAFQAAGAVDYLVASEELEPGAGWDYAAWLKAVSASNKTPAAVASALVDTYIASYADGGSQSTGGDEATLAAVDVNAFTQNVVPALNTFSAAAVASIGAHKATFQAARAKSTSFYNKDCADLGSFLENLTEKLPEEGALTKAANDLERAYAGAVVRNGHSRMVDYSSGLVLYFPTATQRYNPVYDDANKIGFARTEWKSFLKAIR